VLVKTVPIGRHDNYSISSAWFTAIKKQDNGNDNHVNQQGLTKD
jgi:hypothetical protein